ncbi:MAG: small multi-drug export protein [Planctomycetota bacterium]
MSGLIENPLVHSFVLSLLPISELRGGIPYAVANGIHPLTAYIVCVISNILVIPLTFIFLETVHKVFYRVALYQKLFDKFIARTKKKAQKNVDRWGYWGVMMFVAIPLPVTGAYTGTVAAWLLQLDKKRSYGYLALGVVLAGVIVSIATLTGIGILKLFTK